MQEKKLSENLLGQIKDQVAAFNELANSVNMELGETNLYAKKFSALKQKLESIFTELTISQSIALEKAALKDSKFSNLNLTKNSHPKKKGNFNNAFVDNINYYIRYLKNEADVYLLYEFFDLIVAKVKEYGGYDAEQIWSGISQDVKKRLPNNTNSISDMRDILNNRELKEGLQAYANLQRLKNTPINPL